MEQETLNRNVLKNLKDRMAKGHIDMKYIESEKLRCEKEENYPLAIAIREAIKQL